MKAKSKFHYGWVIMVGCFILLLYAMGLVMVTFSVFIPSLAQQFGLNRTQSSSLMTIQSVLSIVVMMCAGKIYKKYSVRLFSFIFGLFGVLGYVIYAYSNVIWMCYLGSAALGIAQGGATMIPVSILLTKWFAQKRGLALGIATAGSGVAPMIFSPIIGRHLQTSGTSSAFLLVAGIIAVMAVLVVLILRDKPADMGLTPYGADGSAAPGSQAPGGMQGPPPGLTLADARKNFCFYVLIAGCFLLGMTFVSTNNHYVAYLVSTGFDPALAAIGFSIMGAAGLIVKPMHGVLADKMGTARSNVLFYILWIVAQAFAVWATGSMYRADTFAILIAAGSGLGAIAMPLWISDIFGYRDYGQIYSFMMTCYQVGITLGLMLFGIVADISGSYMNSYLLNAVFSVLSLVFVQAAYRMGAGLKKAAPPILAKTIQDS